VVKITSSRIDDVKNPTSSSLTEPKSMLRIDITPRHRDTALVSTKISSFTNDVG
jgi:hypothetical protein